MLPTAHALRKGVRVVSYSRTKLARKHAVRIRKEALWASVAFAVLTLLLHHVHEMHSVGVVSHGVIEPRRTVDELRSVPRNVYYMQRERVQYCYIPKNACSRLKPILRKREGFADWADPHMIHGKRNGLQRLQWLDHGDALRRLNDSATFRFVVVRNPFSRLVSAYQNKVASPWPDQRANFWNIHLRLQCPGLIDAREMPAEGPLLSLVDFLKCINADDRLEPSNEHWRPQAELCGLDFIKYDRYIFLENFQEGVAGVLKALKWDEDTGQFAISRKPVFERDLASYFSPEAVELALKYYKEDFDLLGYPRVPSGTIGFYSVFNGTNFHPDFVPPVDYQADTGVHSQLGAEVHSQVRQ